VTAAVYLLVKFRIVAYVTNGSTAFRMFLPREAAMLVRSWDRNSLRPSVRNARAL